MQLPGSFERRALRSYSLALYPLTEVKQQLRSEILTLEIHIMRFYSSCHYLCYSLYHQYSSIPEVARPSDKYRFHCGPSIYQHEKPYLVLLPADKKWDTEKVKTDNLQFERHSNITISDIRQQEVVPHLAMTGF